MSLRRPKPPIKGGSAPEEEEEIFGKFVHTRVTMYCVATVLFNPTLY